jgi:diguanylate cyclase (GGDEF)-like protein
LEDALDRVKLLATTDVLTGLSNRRGLLDLVPMLFAQAERSGQLVGVLMADVDHFKQFNDRFGHLAGDEALRRVAGIIRGTVRQTDIVARFGGEEMCVVTSFESSADFEMLGERIRKNVEASKESGVTLSVGGYVCRPATNVPAAELFWSMVGLADERLYEAKGAGRNVTRIHVAHPAPFT